MEDFKEIKSLRRAREKHFLKKDGTMVAQMYAEDIHYLKDGVYEEIDFTFDVQKEEFTNEKNSFRTRLKKVSNDAELIKLERMGHTLSMYLKNENNVCSNLDQDGVSYIDLLDGIDFKYQMQSNKIKESIILKDPSKVPSIIEFGIDTDLDITIPNDGTLRLRTEEKELFVIEPPYMIDALENRNDHIYYEVRQHEQHYDILLHLDKDWLQTAEFPVMIDPTISSTGQNTTVYDTYIYPGDTYTDRNRQDVLKIGVEQVENSYHTNRALIKFDLPTIGTGSQIIGAEATFIGYECTKYPTPVSSPIVLHRLTKDWDESTACWDNMSNQYDPRIEEFGEMKRSLRILYEIKELEFATFDITNLVKQWYSGVPNYGFMMKSYKEQFTTNDEVGMCYSKNNHIEGFNPKPYLTIHYRNQNGLENYLNTQDQSFTNGTAHMNLYNGNLTTCFQLGTTREGKLPINLILYYNTNDVVLNHNYGYGLGYQLNFHQEIKEVTIETSTLLEYLDADGTLHYFYKGSDLNDASKESTVYYDEDGLSLQIKEVDGNYIMRDNDGNTSTFMKSGTIWYLTEIKDTEGNVTKVEYDSNHRITKIRDANLSEIILTYNENQIVVTSVDDVVILDYDEHLKQITTKNGMTQFHYNSNHIVEKIIDTGGRSVGYDYYDISPYRIKKISEYGIQNTIGNYLDIIYGFNITTLIDPKGKCHTYTFNQYGNTVSLSNLKQSESVYDAYGTQYRYWEANEQNKSSGKFNKLQTENPVVKTVNNYIENSSFEESQPVVLSVPTIIEEITTEDAVTGTHSLKLTADHKFESKTFEFNAPKGKTYTYSAYFKHNPKIKFSLHYLDSEQREVRVSTDELLTSSNFHREELTIEYPNDAQSSLYATITFLNGGIVYMDDMQLEEGNIANLYNIISNSDFSHGLSGWTVSARKSNDIDMTPIDSHASVITLDNGHTTLKLEGALDKTETLERKIPISGKKGDSFDLYFWYKNNGIEHRTGWANRHAIIMFDYVNPEGEDIFPNIPFTCNHTQWQLFHSGFVALYDYTSIRVIIYNVDSVNELYLTNFSLFKSTIKSNFDYDNYGNMISSSDPYNGAQTFQHDKNNQLIQMTDVKGNHLTYEYDHKIKDRILRSFSATGITNETKYDEMNHPIMTKVYNKKPQSELKDKTYYIRKKGTDQYLDYDLSVNKLVLKENSCSHDAWDLQKIGDDYKIIFTIQPLYSLFQYDNKATISKQGETLFVLLPNKNGSYQIKEKETSLYLTATEEGLLFSEEKEDDESQQFYFEEQSEKLFIENQATYTEDGKFITSVTDTLGRTTEYHPNHQTGLVDSITDAKGITTSYTYNDQNEVTKVERASKKVEYEYNIQNLLSNIKFGTKNYCFDYDEFGNQKEILIGNQPLITYHYEENNGNLSSSIYGNHHMISYAYDDFDRLKTVTKMGRIYDYAYDNLGNLTKVDSNSEHHRYYYDLSGRLSEYQYNNNFRIQYQYGDNSTVSKKHYDTNYFDYELASTMIKSNDIEYEYNKDDQVTKVIFDGRPLNYFYDTLGRLQEKNINGDYITKYRYVTNGNRTSYLLQNMLVNDHNYTYQYDQLNNITDISYDDILIHHYEYDEHNQLLEDHDYKRNRIIKYEYDSVGNLLLKEEYELSANILLKQDTYEYDNENWEDQLTKYNDISITYDEIGNPLSIGNDELLWKNGRQLSRYKNGSSNQIYRYDYNKDGIRTKKEIQGFGTTYYYLEDNQIVVETDGSNMLYYIRDDNDELLGVKYNNVIYYYEKNAQGDIVAILDNMYNKVVQYQYDAWGQILSITDAEGNVITDPNHIAHINPFRYRSYYYDKETNLYYLNSRYYNPVWGRFLNADEILGDTSQIIYNLYSYCGNNPVNLGDVDGNIGLVLGCVIIGAVAGALAGAVYGAAKSKLKNKKIKAKDVAKSAVIGGIGGAIVGTIVGVSANAYVNYATTGSPNKIGKIGERWSGIFSDKGKKHIVVKTRTRIPDKLSKGKYVMEVKNVKSLTLTSQIRDTLTIANTYEAEELRFILKIRHTTKLSGPLQEFIKQNGIIIKYLPW